MLHDDLEWYPTDQVDDTAKDFLESVCKPIANTTKRVLLTSLLLDAAKESCTAIDDRIGNPRPSLFRWDVRHFFLLRLTLSLRILIIILLAS